MQTETQYWTALQNRDAKFDGVFFYGVATTGIYCRPSCPSRQPNRENVSFFLLPNAARLAGFRACRRCRPNNAGPGNPQAAMVQAVCRAIEEDPDAAASLDALGRRANLSPGHLQRVFKKWMGISPRQYGEALRFKIFKRQIRAGRPITQALYEAGFGSSSRLYEKTAPYLGMTPAAYRKGGENLRISFTITDSITDSKLGHLLVAATSRGICSVALGDSDADLIAALEAEFPRAAIERDTHSLSAWVKVLVQHLAGQHRTLELPLDVTATAFQQRVWEELRRIPYGETASYSEIAQRLGQPTAARAVARACAANPVALITPCHRVIRGNGELSGYRWGLARKEALLKLERSAE